MTEIGGSESSQLLSSITETEDKAEGDEDPEHTGDMGQEVSGRDSDGGDEMMETYSESNSTAISHNINHRQLEGGGAAGGARAGGSQFVRAEPLSAKQQVALWLTRTSMSDLSSMPSINNIVGQSANSQSSNCQTNHHSNSIRQNYYHQHRL